MRLKTLLVCLTTPDNAETLMKVAVPLARKHGAHLTALHTIQALVVYPGIAVHIPDESFAAFNESQKLEAAEIKAVFSKHTDHEDFPSEFRLVQAEATSATERMVESARASDLVIMAHEDKDVDRYDQRHARAEVIRHSGRPVIVVPLDYDGPDIGTHLLLGWSDTREAARAAHDALMIADEGAAVTVLRISDTPKDALKDPGGIDLVETYARHGLKPTLDHHALLGGNIAQALNEVAFEKGADLIVTGAFGHSKAYDFVIGATTYALLREAKLPVLFSK